MTKEAKRILRRWAKAGFVVYIRPYYLQGSGHWWSVQVEGGPRALIESGHKLTDLILSLAPQVPKAPSKTFENNGWLMVSESKKKK